MPTPFRVFISHAAADVPLATAIKQSLQNAFDSRIELFLSSTDLKAGANWSEELVERLKNSEALLSLITTESIGRPWIFVEWSPFWMERKPFFLLLEHETLLSQVFGPMKARQAACIQEPEGVKSLLRGLAACMDIAAIPYHETHPFLENVRAASKARAAAQISRLLAGTEEERADAAIALMKAGEFTNSEQLWTTIRAGDKLRRVALSAHELGQRAVLRKVADQLVPANGAEARNLLIDIANVGPLETGLLTAVFDHLQSEAERRKLLTALVGIDPDYSGVVALLIRKMENSSEILNVGERLVATGNRSGPLIEAILEGLNAYPKKLERFRSLLE